MVLDYVVTVWENAEPEIYNSEIYTDWANHYLEKARNKRFISDLQQDITDGVLLADVIEAVTNEKVKDIKSKPKNSAQMVENINICLTFLASLGVNVEGLSAKDIKDGNLKSILGLFFSLSRFKQQQKSQQQKQQQQAHHHHHHSDQGKQASHQETASVGESISSAGGRSIPQVNGGEMLSRLPASFKQGNKCPTITNPTTKDSTHFNGNANTNLNNCRNKAQSGASTTSDKVRSHLNQQNNNQQSNSGSTVRNNNTNTREVVSNRATSPSAAPSSIPTPGGKLLGSRGQTAVPEKASSRGSSSANPCTTVSKATSQKASSANKNSMFKFFNSKEKEKIRSGSVKSNSRASSSATSTSSSRSDTDSKSDTKSSASARSSSSMENGTTSGSSSPKPTIKSLTKKGLGRAFNAKRDSAGLSTDDNTSKRSTPSPSPQARTPSPNCTTATRKTSPTSGRKASSKAEKNDQSSPTGSKKGSKIGSLIPKSSTNKTSKSPSLSSVHSNSSSGSQIPTPSSGIPKPTSGKPGKSGKEEKSKGTLGGSRDHNKGVYSQLPGSHKSKSFQHQSIRQQQQPPPPLPDEGQLAQQVLSIPSDNGSAHSREVMEQLKSEEFCSTSRDQTSSPNLRQVAAVQSQSYTGNSSPAMVGKGHVPGKCSSHYVEVTVPAVGYESGRSGKHSQKVNNPEDHIESAVQSINIVKPTRALTPNSAPVAKVDGNTQTNLSALQRPITPVKKLETVKENSGSEIIGENESFSHNRSNAYHFSRNDSFVGQQYDDLINSDKPIGSMNSPRLGVKMLSSQLTKPANNVAIVQPRHGEKIETTFDTEVRTETVNKTSKETYLSDKENKETTFVDDSGETMDIKPMPPIMRAMPYGYFRGYVGSTPNKNFHIPGISVPTSLYAGGGGGSSRLNVNRSYMDHNNFYSGSMKRVMSGGQSALESDYASDIDTYDYISGYMSDGDILRSNRVDDMGSGYLSEGGASLYARRLQQRFREGMQAVKECMQKSSGILDDDSFDDSSSISSGDISDTIAEISTDENLTGSSQCSDHTNPYSSLKRAPKDVARSLANGNLTLNNKRYGGPAGPILASEYRNPADATHLPSGWRKYSLPQNNKIFSDSGDYAYVYSSFDHAHWRKPDGSVGPLRKLSSQSDLGIGLHNSTSFNEADRYSTKRDSETNTDQSCLLEANMRKMQNNRNGGSVNNYGYRRPLSNASSSSVGSNKSSSSKGSVGGRLGKQGDRSSDGSHSSNKSGGYEVSRPACSTKGSMSVSDMGPEAYNSITLERKKKMGGSNGRSSSSAQTDSELYKSNTLGRRKIFGSRSSLSKMSTQSDSMCCSTIISNPHATYSKHDRHGFSGQPHCPQSYSSNYLPLEYSSPRNSGSSNPWLKNSNGNLSSVSGHSPMQMSETESMESISSTASSIQARGLSGARILAHQASHGHHVGLHRSNSIRSTQSECLYSSIHHGLSEDLTRTNSYSHISSPNQPSSPTPSNSSHSLSRFTYPMTAYNPGILSQSYTQNMVRSNTQSSMPYSSLALSKIRKDEDISMHGSSLSLVSTSSSLYSSAEEKQTQEIRKLRRELESAQEKVSTLTTQLSTNFALSRLLLSTPNGDRILQRWLPEFKRQAHVVAAFEQSLSNMTTRLQQLTATAEQKDSELNELRATIEALKRQSGLNIPDPVISPNIGRRHHSQAAAGSEARICRQMSSDSMSSINSLSSACSAASQQSAATDGDIGKKSKKKKGWLRSSFSKAFSRKKNKHGSISDVESDTASLRSNASAPNSPLLQVSHLTNGPSSIKGSHSSGAICEAEDTTTVVELRKQLREKDMKLTDIRLEALSSAHQLEQLRETMNKMRNEMSSLKADNDRLQRMVTSKTWNMSTSSLQHQASNDSLDRSLSLADHGSLGRRNRKTGMKSHAQTDLLIPETPDREGKRVTIMVYLGSNPDPFRTEKPLEVLIGSLSVSGKTKWDILDNIVRKIFKEYVLRIDPVTNLGLSAESVFSYHIGEIVRTKDSEVPELLPIGYLVGETMQIGICLKGTKQNSVDSLAFETQIPKSIIQRYVSLLLEHRRIILCGPSGTGKTYLAQKLAEHLVLRSGKELTAGAVATFSVDHKSGKELRQYLANIAEQCESTSAGELPSVIILDNLHHVGSLGEVFNGFLSVKYQKCPYIIGTMNQATCSTTNLQLHHNFRWVLCANHMEPVKGFLGRYLRRKLVEAEVRMGTRNNDLNKIIDWIPKVWQHLNKFLETHSSSDVTIGPRLFLCCPMDISGSQVWFTDLWNYSIIPYLLEAVREGLQVYGKRAPWEDPADWVIDSYPWANTGNQDWPSLLRLRPEDVGYDTQGVPADSPKTTKSQNNTSEVDGDPLLNMLMRLQEAASYSSPQSNDSDSTSLDSHCSSIQEFSSSSVESML